VAGRNPVTTARSIVCGGSSAVKRGGSTLDFGEATAGSRGRAAVQEGPQVPSQQGIGALRPDSETQHDEHNAESGAARKAAPTSARTTNRSRVICSENLHRLSRDSLAKPAQPPAIVPQTLPAAGSRRHRSLQNEGAPPFNPRAEACPAHGCDRVSPSRETAAPPRDGARPLLSPPGAGLFPVQ